MNSVHNPIPLNFSQPECAEDCPRTVRRVRVPPAGPAGWSAFAPGHSGCSASGTGTPPLNREGRGNLSGDSYFLRNAQYLVRKEVQNTKYYEVLLFL